MMRAGRLLRDRLGRMILSTTNSPVSTEATVLKSEGELRSMNHDQLLAYTLGHLSTSTDTLNNNGKRKDNTTDGLDGGDGNGDVGKKAKRRKKEFDMSRYGQRMIALKLNYQGWKFHGFATQVNNDNTVEYHLFSALKKTRLIESTSSCNYSRAGRTDVGVSALAQVIGVRVRSAIVHPSHGRCEIDYVKTINSALPNGMCVTSWSPVGDGTRQSVCVYEHDDEHLKEHWRRMELKMNKDDHGGIVKDSDESIDSTKTRREKGSLFSARFDALSRSYKYFFPRGKLDIAAMNEAAKYFEGCHDFRNFCRFDDNVTNFERVLKKVDIRRCRDGENDGRPDNRSSGDAKDDEFNMYYVYVEGQAFLWHQVRCMVAVLFDVGHKLEEPSVVFHMLNDVKRGQGPFANGRPHYQLASPTPLLLFQCIYPPSVLCFDTVARQCQPLSTQRADDRLAQAWTDEECKGAVIKQMMMDNESMLGKNVGTKRQLVPEGMARSSKYQHVAYARRQTGDPVSVKIERAQRKKSSKLGQGDQARDEGNSGVYENK